MSINKCNNTDIIFLRGHFDINTKTVFSTTVAERRVCFFFSEARIF